MLACHKLTLNKTSHIKKHGKVLQSWRNLLMRLNGNIKHLPLLFFVNDYHLEM